MVIKPCILYQNTPAKGNIFLTESRKYLCPSCQKGYLQFRDYCKRIVRYEDGSHEWIKIPRHKCDNPGCNRIHRMLPHELVPYKHYAEETVSGVLGGIIQPDDQESEDFPSEKTMDRWHHWLAINELNINGMIRSVAFRELGYSFELLKSGVSLLGQMKESFPDSWLRIIVRFIYNSGGRLAAAVW